MTRIGILLGLALTTVARAQAPRVEERTGTALYEYSIPVPEARGRFQPTLALQYRSDRKVTVGLGVGWALSTSHIEVDSRAALRAPGLKNTEYVLTLNGSATRLVPSPGESGPAPAYRPEVASTFTKLTRESETAWRLTDASGNTMTFSCVYGGTNGAPCTRWELASVVDHDGNATTYRADPNASVPYEYNAVAGGFATRILLEWEAGSATIAEMSGQVVSSARRLAWIKVQNRASNGSFVTVRSYRLAYVAAASSGVDLLRSVSVFGGDGAQAGDVTTFSYGPNGDAVAAGGLTFGGPVSFTMPTGYAHPAWIDIDRDGRLDLAQGGTWARNVTPANAGNLSFAAPAARANVVGAVAYDNPSGEVWSTASSPSACMTSTLADLNGDGFVDLLAGSSTGWTVRFGDESGGVGSVVQLVGTSVAPFDKVCVAIGHYTGYPLSTLTDVNGDGVLDYVRRDANGSTWQVATGYRDRMTLAWGFSPAFSLTADSRPFAWGSHDKTSVGAWAQSRVVDVNGDGLDDRVLYDNQAWVVRFGNTQSIEASGVTWWSGGDPITSPGGGVTSDPARDLQYDSCGQEYMPAFRRAITADVDGDGWLDRLHFAGSGSSGGLATTYFGTGSGFIRGADTWLPGYPSDIYKKQSSYKDCDFTPCLTCTIPARGTDTQLVDVDGDGVTDYVRGNVWYRGSNGLDGGRSTLLRAVTVGDGATFEVTYASGTKFGYVRGATPDPVVKRITVSGPAMVPGAVEYWYRDPVIVRGVTDQHWPERWERRGFKESWSRDSGTKIITHSVWETASHAFAGALLLRETGAQGTGSGDAGTEFAPPSFSVSERVATHYGAWSVASVPASGVKYAAFVTSTEVSPRVEPLASQYPLLVLPLTERKITLMDPRPGCPLVDGKCAFQSSVTMNASRVDVYGNALEVTRDPDLSRSGDDVTVRNSWTNPDPICKNCQQTVEWIDPANGNVIQRRRYVYDAAGRPTGEAEVGTEWLEYNGNGTVVLKRVGDPQGYHHTIEYVYDPAGLRVTKTYTYSESAGNVSPLLITETAYDDRGFAIFQRGPYRMGDTMRRQVWKTYDALGRLRVVSTSAPTSSAVPGAVVAYEYLDASFPRATRTYTFATAGEVSLVAPLTAGDGVRVATVFRDGLGRAVQTRERLGAGGSGAPAAHVTQSLAGYRVSGVVLYDAAGRAVVAYEPFYASGADYVDYRASVPAAQRPEDGIWAQTTSYDSAGRVSCVTRQVVDGAAPRVPSGPAECVSSLSDNASYMAATRFEYEARAADGAWFVAAITTRTPAFGAGTAESELSDAGGRVVYTVDAAGNRRGVSRDRLGRETSVFREAAASAGAPSMRIDFVRDYAAVTGRLLREYDGATGVERSIAMYDAYGNPSVVRVYDANGVKSGEVRSEFKAFGRITSVRSYTYPDGVEVLQSTATYRYDTPFDQSSQYTAGALSWASVRDEVKQDETVTTWLGYDALGRVVRQAQSFSGIDGVFASSATLRSDGLALERAFSVSGVASAPAPAVQRIEYDSAGRPVLVASAATQFWSIPLAQPFGGYDALGRPGLIKADDGNVQTTRAYSRFTGQLTTETKTVRGAPLYAVGDVTRSILGVTKYTDALTGSAYEFFYDDTGRLERARASATGCPSTALTQRYDESYSFRLDGWLQEGPSVGNLQRVVTTSGACNAANTGVVAVSDDESYAYKAGGDVLDRIRHDSALTVWTETFVSDGLGRLTTKSSGTSFAYDLAGNLTAITAGGATERMRYGPGGELVMRIAGRQVTYYAGRDATITGTLPDNCAEPSAACKVTPASVVVESHVLLGTVRIASVRPDRTLYFYRDQRGSVVATSLGGGVIGAAYRYTPYGAVDKVQGETPATASDEGFTGALKLRAGILHMSARAYDPALRRFLQPDTVDPERYTYVNGDPINYTDPSGRTRVAPGMEELYLRTFHPSMMPRGSFNLFIGERAHDASVRDEMVRVGGAGYVIAARLGGGRALLAAGPASGVGSAFDGSSSVMPPEGSEGNPVMLDEVEVETNPDPAVIAQLNQWADVPGPLDRYRGGPQAEGNAGGRLRYLDLGFTVARVYGFTAGVIFDIDAGGIRVYAGPVIGVGASVALTGSSDSPTEGWNIVGSANVRLGPGCGFAGQVGIDPVGRGFSEVGLAGGVGFGSSLAVAGVWVSPLMSAPASQWPTLAFPSVP